MQISVIIPTYRPKDYIWECLDSLRQQTLSRDEFEIILILNGEKEPYYSRIKEYLSLNLKDFNVNIIYTEVAGVSNARNIGLDISKGEYITFMDDDDFVSATFLEKLLETAGKTTVSLSNALAFNDPESNIYIPYHVTNTYQQLHEKTNIKIYSRSRTYFSGPCMKLIHRDIIGDRRFDIRFKNGEDSLFMFLISDKISEIVFSEPSAIYYRRFRTNSALTRKRSRKEILFNNLRAMVSYTKIFKLGKYSFLFYVTRLIAVLRSTIL